MFIIIVTTVNFKYILWECFIQSSLENWKNKNKIKKYEMDKKKITSASLIENWPICLAFSSLSLPSVRDLALPFMPPGSINGVYELGFRKYTFRPYFWKIKIYDYYEVYNRLYTFKIVCKIHLWNPTSNSFS